MTEHTPIGGAGFFKKTVVLIIASIAIFLLIQKYSVGGARHGGKIDQNLVQIGDTEKGDTDPSPIPPKPDKSGTPFTKVKEGTKGKTKKPKQEEPASPDTTVDNSVDPADADSDDTEGDSNDEQPEQSEDDDDDNLKDEDGTDENAEDNTAAEPEENDDEDEDEEEKPAEKPVPVPVKKARGSPDSFQPTTNWAAKKLTFWISDFHISPVEDIKSLFAKFGISLIIKSLSGHCHLTGTCAHDLRVIGRDHWSIGDVDGVRRAFFQSYQNDGQMRQVDGFLCFHSAALCEIFMPFNKTIMIISTTRYEFGREDPPHWKQLNDNIRKIARSPRNFIGANSVYDRDYVNYFTGVKTETIPSYCGYVNVKYTPSRPQILLGAMHVPPFDHTVLWGPAVQNIRASAAKIGCKYSFEGVRILYQHYQYTDLASHPAIVHIPYQASVMSYFEHYRMNLPMFFPSLEFLTSLHWQHGVVYERTWSVIRGRGKQGKSDIDKDPSVDVSYDPNNELDREALKYWLAKSDFYQWPHVQYFDSWDDLIHQVNAADLQEISRKMAEHNAEMLWDVYEQWDRLLERMFKDRPEGGYAMPATYEQGMAPYR